MATIKSYTDINQSKKLADILPLESADMWYSIVDNEPFVCFERHYEYEQIPCWSLAALLEQLPYELCDDDGHTLFLEFNKEDDVYQLVYTDPHGDFESIETDRHEHFVDACVSMILKLNELNVL